MKETGGTNNSRMKNKGRNQPPRPKPQGRVISPIKTVRVIVSAFRDCKIYGCLRSDHTRVCVCVCPITDDGDWSHTKGGGPPCILFVS